MLQIRETQKAAASLRGSNPYNVVLATIRCKKWIMRISAQHNHKKIICQQYPVILWYHNLHFDTNYKRQILARLQTILKSSLLFYTCP